jgi:hypothetical protein
LLPYRTQGDCRSRKGLVVVQRVSDSCPIRRR